MGLLERMETRFTWSMDDLFWKVQTYIGRFLKSNVENKRSVKFVFEWIGN